MIPTMTMGALLIAGTAAGGGGGGGGTGWNASDKTSNVTLSNGDLTAAANTNNYEAVRALKNDFNTTVASKYYWEVTVDALATAGDLLLGVRRTSDTISTGSVWTSGNYALWRSNGNYYANGWTAGSGPVSYTVGDVLMFAIDTSAGKLWCGKNGTWNNSGNPAAGTNASFTTMPSSQDTAPIFHTDNDAGNDQATLVTDSGSMSYTPPSGFTAGF